MFEGSRGRWNCAQRQLDAHKATANQNTKITKKIGGEQTNSTVAATHNANEWPLISCQQRVSGADMTRLSAAGEEARPGLWAGASCARHPTNQSHSHNQNLNLNLNNNNNKKKFHLNDNKFESTRRGDARVEPNKKHISNMVARNYSLPRSLLLPLAARRLHALGLVALLALLVANLATADNFNAPNSGAQNSPTASTASASDAQHNDEVARLTSAGVPAAAQQAASAAAAALQDSLATSASNNNYQQHEGQHGQQQQAAGKSKRIQIVYIKVPLAKLRPSLAGGQHQQAADAGYGSTNSTRAQGDHYETTDFKSQGSQQQQFSANDEQQLMSSSELANDNTQQQQQQAASVSHRREPQSFLIPMALVQSQASEPQQQAAGDFASGSSSSSQLADETPQLQTGGGLGQAGSQLHAAHAQPWPQHWPGGLQAAAASHFWLQALDQQQQQLQHLLASRSPSLQQYQQQQQLQAASSNQQAARQQQQVAALPHGFMSNFLLGEKEKMTQAALRLAQQQLYRAAATNGSSSSSTTSTPTLQLATSNTNPQQQPNPLTSTQSDSLHPKGPGGLMPSMIAPLSRMPDNAIGQAYGAAVGIALPAESGSPTNLLSSPSTSNYGQQHQHQARNAHQTNSSSSSFLGQPTGATYASSGQTSLGGASGTAGNGAYSPGTGSSTSYGASGPNQHASGSSATNSQHSASDYGAPAPSSGFGSGTSTLGASAAFSDYPGAPLIGNSHYSHPSSQHAAQAAASRPAAAQASHAAPQSYHNNQNQNSIQNGNNGGPDEGGYLKQAKKTIIPIVVQVEHAILENNQQPATGGGYQQQPAAQQAQRGNKYGQAGQRGFRQMGGGGKRARYNSKSQQLYGAATNEIAQYGDIPPGAQWVNAANAYDINQITAQINAENAASAAAALAQADAAFNQQAPYQQAASVMHPQQPGSGGRHYQNSGPARPHAGNQQANNAAAAYAAGLQSAASALLAQTHPVFQAAASGGLASVSKLGAKLGEMIALPSMAVPQSIASIGQSLPSAFSSLTNQMGVQLGQVVQQAAKEHPTATAFARQVAQQAGIQLPNFANGQQQQQQAQLQQQGGAQMSPQAQLQNLKLGIGHSLQSAASSLMSLNQKANSASGGLLSSGSSPASSLLLGGANQAALSAAIKQLGAISPAAAQLASQLAGMQAAAAGGQSSQSNGGGATAAASSQQQTVVAPPGGESGAGVESPGLLGGLLASAPTQQQQQLSMLNQFLQQQSQVYRQLANLQQAAGSNVVASLDATGDATEGAAATNSKPAKASSTFKSKFLSLFQTPKFITNLISWNDRADERNDQVELLGAELAQLYNAQELASAVTNQTTSTSLAPNATTRTSSAATTVAASTSTTAAKPIELATTVARLAANGTGAASTITTVAASSAPITTTTVKMLQETTPKLSTAAPVVANATARS